MVRTARARLALVGAAGLVLSSLSACGTAAAPHTATASPIGSATSTGKPDPSAAIALTCAVMSAIETTALNAHTGYAQGKISVEEYVGAVNTIPPQYTALTEQNSYGLRDLVATAKSAIGRTSPKVAGAVFDPDGQPYRAAADALAAACNDHHAILQISGLYGG